jgi:2'-5' RNA ligase
MRLFFALQLSDDAKSRLRPALSGIAQTEQLHFTLAFLGEQPESALARIQEAAEAVRAQSFELAIAGTGAFPDLKRPRVLWLGVSEGVPQLTALAERLRGTLRERGFTLEDRPFRPHLTIARVKDRRAVKALERVPAGELARMHAGEFTLVESVLGRGGARHTVLRAFPLERGS